MKVSPFFRLSCAGVGALLLSIWSAGCGGGSGNGPNIRPTNTPFSTPAGPTATPDPNATPTPTPDPNATATPTPRPTATPTARPTATPTPRPIGAQPIAFVSTRDNDAEIYIMNSDGSTQTRLTNTPGDDLSPSQSRDAQLIAFESSRDGNYEIYTMNRDGSDERRLTMDMGTTRPTDSDPVFSPDSQTIAWTSRRGGVLNIWLMDFTGANQRRLTDEPLGSSNAAFSPDGTRIAYVVRRSTGLELELRNLATGAVTPTTIRLLNEPDHLRFNAAGTRIAFSDNTTGAIPRLFIADLTSNTVVPGPSAGTRNIDPDFSPNGNSFVWAAGAFPATTQIYVANADGSNRRVITGRGANSDPDW